MPSRITETREKSQGPTKRGDCSALQQRGVCTGSGSGLRSTFTNRATTTPTARNVERHYPSRSQGSSLQHQGGEGSQHRTFEHRESGQGIQRSNTHMHSQGHHLDEVRRRNPVPTDRPRDREVFPKPISSRMHIIIYI